MTHEFTNQIAAWISSDHNGVRGFRNLKAKIDYLTDVLYHEYMPTLVGVHGEFRYRLAKWINSASTDEQKKLMYLLLEHLFFVGQKEFESLYLTAYSRHIAEWIFIQENIQLDSPQAKVQAQQAVGATLFTAITDSFKLGDFLRLNAIQGADFRFFWEQGLAVNWNPYNFNTQLKGKTRIVLLEDFVGSGSQMNDAVEAACSLPGTPSVLLCPLIICPAGATLANSLTRKYANLTYKPVLEVTAPSFVTPMGTPEEPSIFKEIRDLVVNLHSNIRGTTPWDQDHGPFGYRKTGALIVKHDNCPDNTLPMIHHESNTPWTPLFYRVSRVPL